MPPPIQRPRKMQVGALCHRVKDKKGQVLLVTTRESGRWVIPKGWPMPGLKSAEAALQEAWEEAGVKKARLGYAEIGSFVYNKVLDNGLQQPVKTLVFPVMVEKLADDFPEADERYRKWVSPKKAAKLVREPGLKDILLDLNLRKITSRLV